MWGYSEQKSCRIQGLVYLLTSKKVAGAAGAAGSSGGRETGDISIAATRATPAAGAGDPVGLLIVGAHGFYIQYHNTTFRDIDLPVLAGHCGNSSSVFHICILKIVLIYSALSRNSWGTTDAA